MRAGRVARAHQPAWFFPGVLAVSGMRLHSGYGGGNPGGRGKQDGVLRELREGNGAEEGEIWSVSGVHGLPGLQNDAAAGSRDADRTPAGRAVGREMPVGWQRAGEEAWAVWRVYRVFGIPEVQIHAADHD